ncbi:hypothetical protein J0A67_15295 [Algoriphagus aestuariicola]|uniref:PepSY-associated TM region n=1 Tax=Algoriphagus aestuariicola TaxID=1852016 RepID=A0ABS3BSZ6_9BACT|nr:hypothetical protein [Algoriphagus aestuariicola]MBN7802238.1 hypothetical protein [Algoriphagus aestuariicola]
MDLDIPLAVLLRKVETQDFIFGKFFLTNAKGYVVYADTDLGTQIFDPVGAAEDTSEYFKTGISLHSIQYNQLHYQAYASSLMLGNLKLYFLGIYEDAYFQKVGLRVDYGLLSILLFMLVALVCSIPILAVVSMCKGDVLTQSRVIQVGVSLMALAVVVGFTFSYVKNVPDPKTILSGDIEQVNSEFTDNLAQYYQLKEWDPGAKQQESRYHNTNELLTVG